MQCAIYGQCKVAAVHSLACKQCHAYDCTPNSALQGIADASSLKAVKEWCFGLFLKRKMSHSHYFTQLVSVLVSP